MKRLCREIFAAMAAAAALGACAVPAQRLLPAADRADRGALVLRIGPDTMFVERFELSPTRLYVESVFRSPSAAFRTVDATLNPDGSLAAMSVATFDPASPRGTPARDSTTVTFSADSTIYAYGIGAAKQFIRLPRRGDLVISLPGNLWFPNYVLLATRAPRVTGDSSIGTMSMRLGAYPLVMKRVSRDTVTLWSQIAGTMRVILGPDGRLASLDGTGSSIPFVGTRLDWVNIDSVSRAFAERERVAGRVGLLSARDTARAEVDGAEITVDYGRPTRRGRTIFGTVVPWNRLWRTGANLATHITTTRALELQGVMLPAGRYTLYTVPAPESWTLTISAETGQWGTAAPDESRIVARLPMRVIALDQPVETFTIAVERRASGGALRLAWDRTAAEIDFRVR